MTFKTELDAIFGSENVSDDPEILGKYSRDYSYVQARKPSCVVYATDAAGVQKAVRYAKDHSVPITPRSSSVSFYGAGIPTEGGIVLDMNRMNRILEIDEKDRKVRVEPGVTWGQLIKEMEKHHMMVCNPLLPHPDKSVLTSAMEREPNLIPKYEYNETFQTAEVVMPTGDMFWTGTAIGKGHTGKVNPEGVIPSNRLFMGSQGTLGIATWANLKAFYTPTLTRMYFIPANEVEDIVEPAYQILRVRLGSEFLVLNSLSLASVLAKNAAELNALRAKLPAYTIIHCLAGLHRYPEEKIAYEEEALTEIAKRAHFEMVNSVGGVADIKETLLQSLRNPWSGERWWKFLYKGQRQDVFFHTTMDKVPAFTEAMNKVAAKYQYPAADISHYLQPREACRVCYCEYGFSYDPNNAAEAARVRLLFMEASETALSMGGLFSSPYGPWANMVYSRATAYAETLKTVKKVLDPANIMNPGKLCSNSFKLRVSSSRYPLTPLATGHLKLKTAYRWR